MKRINVVVSAMFALSAFAIPFSAHAQSGYQQECEFRVLAFCDENPFAAVCSTMTPTTLGQLCPPTRSQTNDEHAVVSPAWAIPPGQTPAWALPSGQVPAWSLNH